jgi:phosphate transport system substrate-binding protein
MKKVLILATVVVVLVAVGLRYKRRSQSSMQDGQLQGTITVSGAWALYPMAVRWAEEFQKIHPQVKIDIAAGGAGKGMADVLAGMVDIGMVSRDIYPPEIEKGAWWVSVTRDAVVATVNEKNPILAELLSKGVSKDTLVGIWITGEIVNWGQVVGRNDRTEAIHVYSRSDACGAAETWAGFLGKKQEDIRAVGVYGDPGLADAVAKDVLGIGFNNINYAYDNKSREPVKGLRILPIDLNGNRRIDKDEDFYASRDDITAAVQDNRYPSPPARNLYFVCKGRPETKLVAEFIKWVLVEGQRYVPETGYINLSSDSLASELQKLQDK